MGGRTLKVWTQTLIIYKFCFSIFNQGIWALGSENTSGVSGSLGLPSPVSLLEDGESVGPRVEDLGGAWGVSKGGCWGCGSLRLFCWLLCWGPDQKSSPLSEPWRLLCCHGDYCLGSNPFLLLSTKIVWETVRSFSSMKDDARWCIWMASMDDLMVIQPPKMICPRTV